MEANKMNNTLDTCAICGRLHPAEYLVDAPIGKVCYLCAYDCVAMKNSEPTDAYSDVEAKCFEHKLAKEDVYGVADVFQKVLEERPDAMNPYDDFLNVSCNMVVELKTGYQGTMEELFERECDSASVSKFNRHCNRYLNMEEVEKMFGHVTYDNFDTVVAPHTADPAGTLRIFKLIKPNYEDVVAAVNYMMEHEEVMYGKTVRLIEETPQPMWKNR